MYGKNFKYMHEWRSEDFVDEISANTHCQVDVNVKVMQITAEFLVNLFASFNKTNKFGVFLNS